MGQTGVINSCFGVLSYISFIVAFIASECIGKAYGAALCILSFTACLLKPQSILNFQGCFAFVSKSIPLVLIGKWFINKTRIEQEDLSFVHFLYLLKSKFEVYIAMYSTKNSIEGTVSELNLNLKRLIKLI